MTDARNHALNVALDRFDVPALSAGLADRIVAAAAASSSASAFDRPRRDRRGLWRRGRQVLLGSLAVGLLSAGAVASGLLGRVGIEVPVLTAMLAPKPKPVVVPVHRASKPPVMRTATVAPPAMVVDPAQAGLPSPVSGAERVALRQERRERIQAFAAAHPVAAAVIRERVRERLQERALARRQALMVPGIDPSLPGARSLDLADRAALAKAARRDRLVAERMIDRRLQAREARLEGRKTEVGPAPASPDSRTVVPLPAETTHVRPQPDGFRQATPEQREARRARLQQMSPEQRSVWRERVQQRRAARLGRRGQE